MGKKWKQTDFLFLGSKITADGDCSHEIKKCFLLGRKAMISFSSVQFSSVAQSCPTLCDPWITARQASLSITNSWRLLKLMPIEWVMPSSHLILCPPLLLLPPIPPQHQGLFQWVSSSHEVGQSIGVSASTSVLPMNTQDSSPLGWTGWVSLQAKGLSRVFSITTVQKHRFFGAQLSSQSKPHIHTWPLEKLWPWLDGPLLAKQCLCFLICYLGWSYLSFQGVSTF